MEPFADMGCVLKVNVHCDACKMQMMEVLSSINGVYSVSIDSQDGLAKVSGEVDPNILLRALARTGNHAELVWVKLKHPVLARGFQGSYGYGKYHNPYGYGSTLYDHPWHDAHQPYHSRRRPQVDYPWCNTTYRHGYGGYGRGSFYGHGYGYGHHNHGF